MPADTPTPTRGTTEPSSAPHGQTHMAETAIQALPHSCGRCPAQWAGNTTAHCPACHRTFSGPSTFDAHRIRNTNAGGCHDPATIGMIERHWPRYTTWGNPLDETAAERLRSIRKAPDAR